MRKTVLLVAWTALAMLPFMVASGGCAKIQESSGKPNFVFILADDMRADHLKYMPETRALLGDRGVQFENAYVSYGLCCPSRATILRGQYAHNHEVWSNTNSPDGGWQGYKNHGNEQDNLATRLRGAGYRTGLLGKYFNHYEGTAVPPGWDDWFAMATSTGSQAKYFDYKVNDNGHLRHFGTSRKDYSTDVLSNQTQEFIDASVAVGKPFFAYVAPVAPHGPPEPAPRHRHAFDNQKAPRLPSFNEEDVSDKPAKIRSLPSLSDAEIAGLDDSHEKRVETLQALDDLVEAVVSKLQNVGALHNTYVVFTSDNGYHFGEHRIPEGKSRPYEESVHMPLLIRGPAVQAGSITHKLVLNTDFFPTFMDLAGAKTPEYVDGRSLRPVLEGSAVTWRTAVLLELRNSSYGVRTSDGRKYVEYESGVRELYDLNADPYELRNKYKATAPPKSLVRRIDALKSCAGATCRAAEDGHSPRGGGFES